MTLLFSTHTLNLVFLPKSVGGPLKRLYPQAPPDPCLSIIAQKIDLISLKLVILKV